MLDSGLLTLGSHTHNMHTVDAADKPPFLKPENLKWFSEDLTTSVQTIQQQTGVRPQYFAYPYGFGMPQTDEIAMRQGMQLLFTLKPGTARSGDPAFYVKRILVNERSWPAVARWAAR
jgi:peptidoglycan/xylan/chitin deacetylase (PgdA/CDA1 family)